MSDREVRVVEVGPRDGLQNERVFISTSRKVIFVDALIDSGLSAVEATSFVHPKSVPQLADAETVLDRITPRDGVRISALVPNMRGLDRVLAADLGHVLDEVAVFTAATSGFTEKNINMNITQSLDAFAPVAAMAVASGLSVRGYVSTAFGCPYEGHVPAETGIIVAERLLAMGCREVSIGDTIGVATPGDVQRWVQEAANRIPLEKIALHFHDTRGTALANVFAALDAGIRTFDASCGGLGGCPYAPGASGNLATEDLVYALHGSGWQTGVDLRRLLAASRIIAAELDHMLPGRYFQAERVGRTLE
jgi:hydroxymethylglutaryl-CoA lyase